MGIPAKTSNVGLTVSLTFGAAYSDKYIAENKPSGVATTIAIKLINKVPKMSGATPNAPDAPTWSALSAVCGLQLRPNKKSKNGTF